MHNAYAWVTSSGTKRGRQFNESRNSHKHGIRSVATSGVVKCDVFLSALFTNHLRLRFCSLPSRTSIASQSIGDRGSNETSKCIQVTREMCGQPGKIRSVQPQMHANERGFEQS